MASSDEEGELIPSCVTEYYFVDHKDEVISFSILPLTWSEDDSPDSSSTQIFLRGTDDSGLRVLYKKVISWKFELAYVVPEFYVLSKDRSWIKLQQPRKGFVSTIKTTLVTVNCLHYIKRKPEASRDDLWNHLLKTFSSLEVDPFEKDLLVHKPLIIEAINRDKNIAKSEYLTALLLDMHEECSTLREQDNQTTKISKFVVDDSPYDSDNNGDNGDESDEDMLFDSVCSFCDNGGHILCCEGRCMRSFHPTEEAGDETLCVSLGYTDAQVEAMKTFLCKNCQYQQHQCFACGLLGSSNISSNAEVFPCVSATCGRFYHSKCVSKLLYPGDGLQAEELEKKIADGDSFICPTHTCIICKQGEDRKIHDLQFAVCRRCPKAYHRKCLPRSISFEDDVFKGIQQRAWDDLLPKRILIYCTDHKMNSELGTPERNHIVFPGVDGKQQHHGTQVPPVKKKKVEENYFSRSVTERAPVQLPFKSKKAEVTFLGGNSLKKADKDFPVQGFKKAGSMHSQVAVSRPSTADKRKSYLTNDESAPSLRYRFNLSGKTKNVLTPVTGKVRARKSLVEAETEARMMALIERSTASFDQKEFIKKQKMLSGNSWSMCNIVEKTITMGKVQASVKAVEAAVKKLKGGCTTEEAKAVCEPQVLKQIFKWRKNLSCYLAPFLHGMRYTSFGRHFTKMDKLKEIVDRLHCYVQEGDMIVDFCCGSNDFSCLLKERLQQMGKSCLFKNYDLIHSKNDFNFEQRDWMSVRPDELPGGSQLIMGLNPPFGIQGVQAYKFIRKALSFKPKLLILIVPRETKQPGADNSPYDLIWEDDALLAGKSFYLPGSVDVNDRQLEQWNIQTPPLYLWSRKDWTTQHKSIALKHGHIYGDHIPHVEREQVAPDITNYLMEEKQDCFADFSHIVNGCGGISGLLDDVPEYYGYTEGEKSRSSMSQDDVQIPIADGWQYDRKCNSYYLETKNIPDEGTKKDSQIEENRASRPHEDVQLAVSHGWQYDQNCNSYFLEPKNIEDDAKLVGNLDGEDDLEDKEMCMDMELSTPPNSP